MDMPQSTLDLDSQLSELVRVQAWVDDLADYHVLNDETRFAIQLCMEEALANVILHGYRNEPGHSLIIRSWGSNGCLYIAIEDKAPHFTPSSQGQSNGGQLATLETIVPGGNGIRLIQRFAGSMTYERLPDGNRLTMGFNIGARKDVSV